MKIPFLDLKKVNAELQEEISNAARSAIDSGWYILGKAGEAFERNCKLSLVGSDPGAVIGCNSGTDALVLSLLAAGVGQGDEVITVSHTAIPTISAIVAVSATPVFVDINPKTWVLDLHHVQKAVSARTKAIVPVHLYGNMVDVHALQELLSRMKREDICIVEDVAQAQGSSLTGRQAGTIGRFGAFSFYPSKNIGALGDGGAVFCRDGADAQKLRSLRNYGQKDRYHADLRRGINSRLDEVQAAILNAKLGRLSDWNKRKAAFMANYRSRLSDFPCAFQQVTDRCEPAWHLCVLSVESRDVRDRLMTHLSQAGIQTLIHYPIPTHMQPAFAAYSRGVLTVTEDIAGRILSLPLNTSLSGSDVDTVIEAIRSFFK